MMMAPMVFVQSVHYHWKRGKIHKDRVYLYRNGKRIGRYSQESETFAKKKRHGWGKEKNKIPVRLPKKYR